MDILKDKQGGEKYLSVYWFAILVVVAVGIFGMVYLFYGSPYDVRELEARILINQIADCVSYAGRINTNFISESRPIEKTGEDFLKICHLNFESGEWEEKQYYTEVKIYRLGDMDDAFLNINAGNNNWPAYCDIQENREQRNFPKCVRDSFYSLDNTGNQYIIKILAIVGKTEKNVKV